MMFDILLVISAVLATSLSEMIDHRMPDVQPKIPDTYLCRAMKMKDVNTYITGFVPHANMSTAHHMLLYGCTTPGANVPVWNCGEMAEKKGDYHMAPTCASGTKIIYAWAMGAPKLDLPKDVAFKVGGDTDIKYLVLQVHYKDVTNFLPPLSETDNSGITLKTTLKPTRRRAGVYLLGTMGSIQPESTEYMETACAFPERDMTIYPFAYRVHAHVHGQVVSGYRIRDGKWTEIGRMDPHKEQMFYNVTNPGISVHKGDVLAARCTMKNDENREVMIGSTQNDEMCNFYVMYYVNGNHIMKDNYCFSSGPPYWHWKNFADQSALNLDARPETISLLPGAAPPTEDEEEREETEAEIWDLFNYIRNRDNMDDEDIGLEGYY